MALIGNYSVLNKGPGQFRAGTTQSSERSNFSTSGALKNRHYGQSGMAKFSAIPNGYVHPYAWSMARTSGGLASYRLSGSVSTTDALLALGLNLDAGLSASMSTTDAALALIVALQASISASGSVTQAQLAIILLLEANLSASGSFTDAQLGNILGLAASLSATGTLTNSITNLVNLSANIGGAEALSADAIASAVRDELAVELARIDVPLSDIKNNTDLIPALI